MSKQLELGLDIAPRRIAVWFSCGVASAVAAKLTLSRYSESDVRIVYNPVVEEDADNLRFLKDCEAWLRHPITVATSSRFPSASAREVWERRRYMSGTDGAPCTFELKKVARQEWEAINKPDYHVLGFTADEEERHRRFTLTERSNVLPVLIDAGMTKQDCHDLIISAGITPPAVYALGYPNANCIGCVKATSVTYWNLVREKHPEVFKDRAEQSRRLNCKLTRYKGKRIFLDELPADATGRPIKTMRAPECGIFCEERNAKEVQYGR